ncbi:hypothetical protein HOY80DRAFT_1086874 [Tuber brumale]|nr:hypothetical protein HOY80DRAFT_1086874 [Tuber brumale]
MSSQKNTPYHEPPSPSPSPSPPSSSSSSSPSSPRSTQTPAPLLRHTNLPHKPPPSDPLKNPSSQKQKWPKQPPLYHCGASMIEVELSAPSLDLWGWNTIDKEDIGQIPENQNPGMVRKVLRGARGVGRNAVEKVGEWVTGIGEKRLGSEEEGDGEMGGSSLSPFLSEIDSMVLVDRRKLFDWCPGYYTIPESAAEEKTIGSGMADPH